MAKYSLEFKLKLIQEMDETYRGVRYIGKKYGVDQSIIALWYKKYKLSGVEGLTKKHGTYSGEFKECVLEYMKQNHLSLRETGLHFKIPDVSVIMKWRDKVEKEGRSSLYEERRGQHFKMTPKKKKTDKPLDPNSIEALLEENEQLRMENAYLKKLRALVQQRQDQEAGKKSKS
jgi:transposase